MQRDKKGRFVKKAFTGMSLNTTAGYDPLQFQMGLSNTMSDATSFFGTGLKESLANETAHRQGLQ
jgi:hypothetical protein